MSSLGTTERPLRVAIIGSGPSGFYAAESLVKAGIEVQADIFERLPAPFGLVRYGVAPDHLNIKAVTKIFDRIAARPNVGFWGNVNVGTDISLVELQRFYDAVLFSNGAASDRRLNIPGEDLHGSYTATEFVAWYNGHPDFRDHHFDLSHEVAVVIGQGNVAVDVCRILCRTVDELKTTDIAQHALEVLAESRVREVRMIGRRGPAQAKFTHVEIKELGEMAACTPLIRPEDLVLEPCSQADLNHPENAAAPRILSVLQEYSANRPAPDKRRLHIDFRWSPVKIAGETEVKQIILEKNSLEGPPLHVMAVGTGEYEALDCGLVFRSVGYRGLPLPGVPFDNRDGVIPNVGGRVTRDGQVFPGVYAAGWIKRGPSGTIGTNKPDSQESVAAILADLGRLAGCENPSGVAVLELLNARGVRVVSFPDWQRIDAAEIERGRAVGKPREKFLTSVAMLEALSETPVR
jgi:ferredoxin--NADP+ reductase